MRMMTPTGSDLLRVWELGERESHTTRSWLMLAPAFPEANRDTLYRLSPGRRNRLLLELRERLMGNALGSMTTCPKCGVKVEFELEVSSMLAEDEPGVAQEASFVVESDEFALTLRLPDLYDADTAERQRNRPKAECVALACLISAERKGLKSSADELPAEVLCAAASALADRDPLSELSVGLECPECGQVWKAPFDPAAFLWAEISTLGKRLSREVHQLAGRYGWTEEAILRMTATRRAVYLGMGA